LNKKSFRNHKWKWELFALQEAIYEDARSHPKGLEVTSRKQCMLFEFSMLFSTVFQDGSFTSLLLHVKAVT
jgi:hypothetical protein